MSEQPTAVQLLHPFWQQQAQAAADAEVEAHRAEQPRAPPPRTVLRSAHAERRAAQAEVERLDGALERARTHLGEVEQHRAELAAEIAAEETRSAEALIAELIEGAAGRPSPTSQIAGERRVALANAEAEQAIAQRAVELLTGDGRQPGSNLRRHRAPCWKERWRYCSKRPSARPRGFCAMLGCWSSDGRASMCSPCN